MELWLVRHGEAAVTERDGAVSYGGGAPLTELGRRQAELLAARLAGASIDHLYASPLRRAAETAHIVAAGVGLEARVDERLREIDPGSIQASSPEGLRRAVGSLTGKDGPMVLDFGAHGGESAAQFGARVAAAVEEVVVRPHAAGAARVVVVSHGGFINAALCALLGIPFTGRVFFGVGNTSVTAVRVTPGGAVVLSVNDRTHLAPLKEPSRPGGA